MIKKILGIAAGVLVVGLLVLWLGFLPWVLGRPPRPALNTTPASLGMSFEDVAFPAKGDGLTIRAWWMPAPNPQAVLIYVHGAGSNRRDPIAHGLEMFKFLVDQDFSVLSPDLRNHGLSDSSPNGRMAMGYDESRDVLGAIDWVSARAPGLPLYVMGASLGGASAIYASAADARVKRLVLFDPILAPHETALSALHSVVGLPRWVVVPVLWSMDHFFPLDPGRHDPLKTAEAITVPVLLIQDDQDRICPPHNAQTLAQNNRSVTLWVSDDPVTTGANHGVAFRLHPNEMEHELTAFLRADVGK